MLKVLHHLKQTADAQGDKLGKAAAEAITARMLQVGRPPHRPSSSASAHD